MLTTFNRPDGRDPSSDICTYTVCSVFTYNVHLDVIIYSMSYFISDTAVQHISMLNENSLIH